MFLPKISHFIRGALMGVADTIPGISGGTIAMIVGVYERLVTAISHCDTQTFSLILSGKWKEAATRIDLLFMATLIAGVVFGIVTSTVPVLHLLENHLPVTFAAFTGLILGSVWILFRRIPKYTFLTTFSLVLGAVAAWGIVSLNTMSGSTHLGYVFLCGMIAICAMILPGISGSYVLLLLGEYAYIIEKVRNVVHLQTNLSELTVLVVFACGCVIGLVSFAKLLRWLLKHFHNQTMAVMCGFMLGSLKCLWPFQKMLEVAEKKEFVALPSEAITPMLVGHVAVALVGGLALIFVLEYLASKLSSHS